MADPNKQQTVVVRMKYRKDPYQPECDSPLEGNPFAKPKPKAVSGPKNLKFEKGREDICLSPQHTQKVVISSSYESDEMSVRKQNSPTIYDRVAARKAWVRFFLED